MLLGHSMGSFVASNTYSTGALIADSSLSGSAAPDLLAHLVMKLDKAALKSLNGAFEAARTPFH